MEMNEQTILCPQCSHAIPLNEALSHQIREKFTKEFDEQMKKKEQELQLEKVEMWKKAQHEADKKLQEKYDLELKDLQKQNQERAQQLEDAQKQELEFRKKMRELEEKSKNVELDLQRRVDEESKRIEEQAKKQAEEDNRLKLLEKDKQMDILKKTIEDLKRQSEQGSMQIQGEVQEAELKNLLVNSFPTDLIEDVPTGIRGADLIQTVKDNFGQTTGIIVWESKNTKAWSGEWLKKLRDDRTQVGGDLCILVSQVLPEGITDFGLVDGVWVVDYKYAINLANILRFHLVNLSQAKKSLEGREEKMDVLYNYLTGTQFKHHIEGIVAAFVGMQSELEREKRSMQSIWNRRQKEIERVVKGTTSLYGDIKGIFGSSLPSVHALELTEGDEDDDKGDLAED